MFQTAGEACYPPIRAGADPDGVMTSWRAEGQGSIALTGDPDGGARYLFDRLPNLPERRCISAAGLDARRRVVRVRRRHPFAELYPRPAERKRGRNPQSS
ncbi:hypothetical protein ACRAWD_24540 [Caulobacter segnis]